MTTTRVYRRGVLDKEDFPVADVSDYLVSNLQEEIGLYGQEFEIYKQVLPGLTGMWQISGRNDLPYRERVNLDVYYVQNWSTWLDIHILLHTVLTILEGQGAY